VGTAAGRERRDDLHRLRRPGLSHSAVCTCTKQKQNKKASHNGDSIINAVSESIDVHTHVVPENFPPYRGSGRDMPLPAMAEAHACHRHVMISGKVYRTVSDGCWSVPRRVEDMNEMRVARQALSPMPELLSYWLPLEDAKVLVR